MRKPALPLVTSTDSVRDVMNVIGRCGKGIALLVAEDKTLITTITDGDVRRAVLSGAALTANALELLKGRINPPDQKPISAPADTGRSVLIDLMQRRKIRQIPLVDDRDRVVGLVTLEDLLPEDKSPLEAVVMAGGFGVRLHPLTRDKPKPMLDVGERPLLEHIVERLKKAGIRDVNLTTHYRAEKIREHFGDGKRFGVNIHYVHEEKPLGTAGGLRLLGNARGPLLVLNGDVVTEVDFRAMHRFHSDHEAELTVGVRKYDVEVPFGVVECEQEHVSRLVEKPVFDFFVNAGIYLLEPSVLQHVPDRRIDMTDLINELLQRRRRVVSFPIIEYWLDIGRQEDYEKARKEAKGGEPES